MGRADFWKPGDPNAICDVCGFKYKLSQLRKRWDGLMCCSEDWNIRQPQDFVRGVRDNRPIPLARPETPNVYVAWNYTQSLSDSTLTADSIRFDTFKMVPGYTSQGVVNGWSLNGLVLNGTKQVMSSTPKGQSTASVNGWQLNGLAINASGVADYPAPTDEAFHTAENLLISKGAPLVDSGSTAESLTRVFAAKRSFTDATLTTESYTFTTGKGITDASSTLETIIRAPTHPAADASSTTESLTAVLHIGSVRTLNGARLNAYALG